MSPFALLVFGFVLGMRHATDADHVVAVSTMVSRERSLRAAAPIGICWGLGHTATLLVVGVAIVGFGVVIPPRLAVGTEVAVGVMLVVLGVFNLQALFAPRRAPHLPHVQHDHAPLRPSLAGRSLRPLVIGVVHGLAGSGAIALLVLGTVHTVLGGVVYLALFGIGTIVGMLLVTVLLALPLVVSAQRFTRHHHALGLVTGAGSVLFGLFVVWSNLRG